MLLSNIAVLALCVPIYVLAFRKAGHGRYRTALWLILAGGLILRTYARVGSVSAHLGRTLPCARREASDPAPAHADPVRTPGAALRPDPTGAATMCGSRRVRFPSGPWPGPFACSAPMNSRSGCPRSWCRCSRCASPICSRAAVFDANDRRPGGVLPLHQRPAHRAAGRALSLQITSTPSSSFSSSWRSALALVHMTANRRWHVPFLIGATTGIAILCKWSPALVVFPVWLAGLRLTKDFPIRKLAVGAARRIRRPLPRGRPAHRIHPRGLPARGRLGLWKYNLAYTETVRRPYRSVLFLRAEDRRGLRRVDLTCRCSSASSRSSGEERVGRSAS